MCYLHTPLPKGKYSQHTKNTSALHNIFTFIVVQELHYSVEKQMLSVEAATLTSLRN